MDFGFLEICYFCQTKEITIMDDEEWIEAEMDEYFHQQPEEEYIDPNDYSYVDPRTGLTPKQQAYLDYQQAWDDYEANWVGTPYMDRTEDPPQWEDFWREPHQFVRPNYNYYQSSGYGRTNVKEERTTSEKIAIGISVFLIVVSVIVVVVLNFL